MIQIAMRQINFLIFIIVSAALLCFDVYKASHTSMTHDESLTYLYYVHMGFMDIISNSTNIQPIINNHILNTVLVKLFEIVFGPSELALRLPNILSHFLYLFFCYRIISRFDERFFIPFFILLNANPFMLDFFSLARGYGMAIAMMSGAFYFYARYLEERNYKYHVLALVMLCFASLANFVLLNVYLLFLLLHNLFEAEMNESKIFWKRIWKVNKINLFVTILFSVVLYEPLRRIKEAGGLDRSSGFGFWHDTVISLIASVSHYSVLRYSERISTVLQFTVILFCTLFLVRCFFFIRHFHHLNLHNKLTLMFGILLFGVALSCEFQNLILGTPFLRERYALFLFPVFIFFTCFLVSDFNETRIGTTLARIPYLLAALFLILTFRMANTKWYYVWKYDSDTKEMLTELNQVRNTNQAVLRLGITWLFEPSINFYRETKHLDWLEKVDRDGLKPGHDYYYVAPQDSQLIPKYESTLLRKFSVTGNRLLKHEPVTK